MLSHYSLSARHPLFSHPLQMPHAFAVLGIVAHCCIINGRCNDSPDITMSLFSIHSSSLFLSGLQWRMPSAVQCWVLLLLASSSTALELAHTQWQRRLPGLATWSCCSRRRSCTNQEASWPLRPCPCLPTTSRHITSTLWGLQEGECRWQPPSQW